MRLKPGTIMISVPKVGASTSDCFVCTGPAGEPGREREAAKEAFLTGMVLGIHALREPRSRLCVAHETQFRKTLAEVGVLDEYTLKKLGVEFKFATGKEEVG